MPQLARTFIVLLSLAAMSAACLVVFIACRWTRSAALRGFAFFLLSFVGIAASAVVPARVTLFGFRGGLILEVASELLYLAALPRFVFGLAGTALPRRKWAFINAAYGAISVYYVLAVFVGAGPTWPAAAFSFALTAAAIAFLWAALHRVEDVLARKLFRRFLIATAAFTPLIVCDSVGSRLDWSWVAPFDRLSMALYLLTIAVLIVAEASRWLSRIAEQKLRSAEDASPESFGSIEGSATATVSSESGSPAPAEFAVDLSLESRFVLFGLSPRQIEIARFILRGYSAKEIAAALDISPKTAENHTYALYRKVGARSRLQFYSMLQRGARD